ncbi:MAG: hypothetical protein ABI760_06610, partial [Ferruginibacter sp.]
MKFLYLLGLVLFCLISSCNNRRSDDQHGSDNDSTTLFHLLKPEETGIDFVNEVVDGENFNILTYRNFYNGGGVAIGDINNDSLPDIYFTS